ncbi:MAG: hypothetical protein ACW980_24585 [Promethearchaeota archaeon]|jgi:hypothetical protein
MTIQEYISKLHIGERGRPEIVFNNNSGFLHVEFNLHDTGCWVNLFQYQGVERDKLCILSIGSYSSVDDIKILVEILGSAK